MPLQPPSLKQSFKTALSLIAIIWAIHLFSLITNTDLSTFGIYPRKTWGAWGIVCAPFVHGGIKHLLSNSIPLLVTTTIILYIYQRIALKSMLIMYLLTGLFVWLMARNSFHIGASGVVYAFVSFLFWMGIFRRSVQSIIIALVVLVLYSGMFFGILPNQPGISWESHLFGALVGILVAYWYKDFLEPNDHFLKQKNLDQDNPKESFFPKNLFDPKN